MRLGRIWAWALLPQWALPSPHSTGHGPRTATDSALGADTAKLLTLAARDLSQHGFYPASRSLGQDSARADRTGGTPPPLPVPHPHPATGLAGLGDFPQIGWTQVPEGRQQSQQPPPCPAPWHLDLLSTGLPAIGRSISFKFPPNPLNFSYWVKNSKENTNCFLVQS